MFLARPPSRNNPPSYYAVPRRCRNVVGPRLSVVGPCSRWSLVVGRWLFVVGCSVDGPYSNIVPHDSFVIRLLRLRTRTCSRHGCPHRISPSRRPTTNLKKPRRRCFSRELLRIPLGRARYRPRSTVSVSFSSLQPFSWLPLKCFPP